MSELYVWQVIRLGTPPDPPFRVLEEGTVSRVEATQEFARQLLQSRCDGPSYRIKPALKLRPEGIRILDEAGNEVLSYSILDLRRDGGLMRPSEVEDES